jgi:LmbE family N-acetylglucosaminyl deacetylase/molybdopterin-guanine dinucleotide biosynthesis protein A
MGDVVRKVSVVIPALDEAKTVRHVIAQCRGRPVVDQIVVVDNGSTDETAAIARAAGAEVVDCPERGIGRAIKAGLSTCRNRWVVKVDADIRNFDGEWIDSMLALVEPGVGMVKSYWKHEVAGWPETYFLIKPMLRRLDPRLAAITLPISAIHALDTSLIDLDGLVQGWGADLDLLYRISQAGAVIKEIELPEIEHNERPLTAYFDMADQLLEFLLRVSNRHFKQRLLLVMAHADDAEIWAGGTVAKHLLDGGRVDLVILDGDEERRLEAEALSRTFRRLTIHHFGAGGDGSGEAGFRHRLARLIDSARPHAVITHAPGDPHPDHVSALRLTQSALLTLPRETAPAQLLYCNGYFDGHLHSGGFEPDTFVDISDAAEMKYESIRNHKSQDPDFWIRMSQSMDILNGMRCGVARAEAFRRSPHPFYQRALPTLI